MKDQQRLGDLWCSEVLAALSDSLDGEVDAPLRDQIAEHLAGCDRCSRFGGEMSRLVEDFREALAAPAPLPAEVSRLLRASLRQV